MQQDLQEIIYSIPFILQLKKWRPSKNKWLTKFSSISDDDGMMTETPRPHDSQSWTLPAKPVIKFPDHNVLWFQSFRELQLLTILK